MDIEKMNEEFNRLIKKWDVKAIEKWLEEKRLEEEQEKRNKRSELFYCAAKEHYPEMVGDEGCDKQCVRCKTIKQ